MCGVAYSTVAGQCTGQWYSTKGTAPRWIILNIQSRSCTALHCTVLVPLMRGSGGSRHSGEAVEEACVRARDGSSQRAGVRGGVG